MRSRATCITYIEMQNGCKQMAEIYCGLQSYNDEALDKMLESSKIDGIIMGDLFCQKRMYDGGTPKMFEMLSRVGESGKRLIFQTPLYNPEQVFEQTAEQLAFIDRRFPGSAVSTSDIGIASWAMKECSNLTLVWNRFGRSRENYHSGSFFSFLKMMGFVGFETDLLAEARRASKEVEPWLVYGAEKYNSMGRICYYRYQLGQDSMNCEKYCRNAEYEMRLKENGQSFSIDGYILGERRSYSDNFFKLCAEIHPQVILVLAKNEQELESHLGEIRN